MQTDVKFNAFTVEYSSASRAIQFDVSDGVCDCWQTDQQTSAEVTFQIVLLDQNDEVPMFYDTDQAVVPENSPPGTFVAVVSAVDADATRPNNQVIARLPVGLVRSPHRWLVQTPPGPTAR